MTNIDWNKPVQTKDGRTFTFVGRGPNPQFPIVGYMHGWSRAEQWTECGHFMLGSNSENDLINVPEKHELWVNVWKGDCGNFFYSHHKTRADADGLAGSFGADNVRVACLHREFEEGEGLS